MKNRILLIVGFILSLSTVAVGQSVYKTPSGKKYHTATCRYVKNVSTKLTIAQAQQIGLTPCSQCRPGQANSSSNTSSGLGIKKGEASGVRSTSVQCRGITKKGARCKRMTKNVNGYCFQHE